MCDHGRQKQAPGRLEDKVWVITGGTSGIGLETVRLFVAEGARVVFCGRGAEAGETIAAECGSDRCVFVRADVTDGMQIKAVIDTAVSRWGQLDVLFNNAGGSVAWGGLTGTDACSETEGFLALNFLSVVAGIQHATPHLKHRRTASIINNSSIAAVRPGFGAAPYAAAKAAIDAYGRSAAMELAPHGVRVNSINPGATATPIFWSGSPGSARGATLTAQDNAVRQAKVEANIVKNVSPLRIGRSGTGKDIAMTALFLASDDSAWMTGQTLVVDGGITTFDAPNKGWMADDPPRDPVPLRSQQGASRL